MDKFELFINSTRVDMKDDFPLSFNFQVSDIAKPESRQASYSKTIVIPASKVNRKLFTNIFDLSSWIDTSGTVNYQPDFNPNLKADAQAFLNGVQVFEGIAQLDSINIVDNGMMEFNIILLGNLIDLFKTIGDEDLSDIDWSDLNHTYDLATIEPTWTPTYGTGYTYPLIDYGYSVNLQTFPFVNMKPAVFVKEYVDRIFSDAGFVYDSDFFTSDFFKHLIIPFNGAEFSLTSAQVNNRLLRASRVTTDQTFTINTGAIFNDDSTGGNYDNGSQYSTVNGRYTVGAGLQGTFDFVADLLFDVTMVPSTSGVAVQALSAYKIVAAMFKNDGTNITLLNSTTAIVSTDSFTTSLTTDNTNSTWYGSNTIGTGRVIFNSNPVTIAAGDTVYVTLNFFTSGINPGITSSEYLNAPTPATNTNYFWDGASYYTGTVTSQMNIGSVLYNTVSDAQYVEGDTIDMNAAIQRDIKKKDFLLWIIKMFNLYIQPDADVSNKLKIEPRDDYYTGTVIDWSAKLDISKEFNIKPMGALEAKRYAFRYKDDKDYFNALYQDTYSESYGQYNSDIINDFIKDTNTIEVGFSATPSVGEPSSDRIIPRIVSADDNGVIKPMKGNPRILYFNGIKASNFTWYITDNSGTNTYSTGYPYSGHLDDPYSPTVDLSWGVPREIYWNNQYGTITYTNANLYNTYYRKMIDEITNRNSKIVTAWFNLNSLDIQKLDFRSLYYFDREYFRLNRVIGYNPLNPSVTQCEFLRIQEGLTFSATTTTADGVIGADTKPQWGGDFKNNLSTLSYNTKQATDYGSRNRIAGGSNVVVIGEDNTISTGVKTAFITGDENRIGGESSGVTLLNSNDNVILSSSDMTVINTNGLRTQRGRDNLTFINGRIVGGKWFHSYANYTEKTYDNDWEHSLILCDATDGNVTVELESPLTEWGKPPMTIKRTDSTGNVVTIDASTNGGTIDGNNSITVLPLEAWKIYSDGLTWWIL